MVKFDPSITFNHTCLRVKDPKRSIEFYQKNFGMKVIKEAHIGEKKFSLYMLALDYPKNKGYGKGWAEREGVLELTHNHGTENDPDFKINNGNEEPHRGFGHICFSVDNISATCEALESQGVKFKKRLSDGRQHDIAFALDPDGYWVELVINKGVNAVEYQTELSTYKFNHSMIRVKDPKKSLKFYTEVLGMTLVRTLKFDSAKFTLYFLGYDNSFNKNLDVFSRQSLLELTHNWGTEDEKDFHYHTGNTAPQGYGHIGISLKDPASLCEQIEKEFPEVKWTVKYNQGFLKKIAFLNDPDGYSIEILAFDVLEPSKDN